jgi:hypothetical protein
MSLTSTWSLVGSHSESNLSPHDDRWMVTYLRGALGPKVTIRERAPNTPAKGPWDP